MAGLTTRSNPIVRRFRDARDGRDAGAVFVEGVRLIDDFLTTPHKPWEALHTAAAKDLPVLRELEKRGVDLHLVTPGVMQFVSALRTPPGVVLRAQRPTIPTFDYRLWKTREEPPLLLLLDRWQSPANVGAVLRAAEGAGVDGVFLLPGTADPFSPQALRASAGSAFRVPLYLALPLTELLESFAHLGIATVAADPHRGEPLWDHDWKTPTALLFGTEGRGLGESSLPAVRVPMAGRTESLNVAVAAGVLLYEARRQRG